MKYLKTYESFPQAQNLKIGDIVYCIDTENVQDVLKKDTKYEIIGISIDEDGEKFCTVKDAEKNQKMGRSTHVYDELSPISSGFFLDRFISELEYNAKKYNL